MNKFSEIKMLIAVAVLAGQPAYAFQFQNAQFANSAQHLITHQAPEPEQPTDDSDESTSSASPECDFWPKCVID